MRIGIPGTFFAAYHLPYWLSFFRALGMDCVVSGESSKKHADFGGKTLPHEFCLPVKVFMGHILDLLAEEVDLIFVPRMTGKGNNHFFCPRFTGLPELVKYGLHVCDNMILSPEVICNGIDLRILTFPHLPGLTGRHFKAAGDAANKEWKDVLGRCRLQKLTLPEACQHEKENKHNHAPRLNIGLLGYAYCLYDPFISKGILAQLRKLDVHVCTWEMIEPQMVTVYLHKPAKTIYWNFGRIMLGTGLYLLENHNMDGLIYASTFGCGPDSIIAKILNLEANNLRKPMLAIILDEHNSNNLLLTRLEAFVAMLAEQKEAVR